MGGPVCSRRRFCAGSAAGLIALGAGCTRTNEGAPLPGWGPNVGGGGDAPDLAPAANPDFSTREQTPDLGSNADFSTGTPDFATANPDFAHANPDFAHANPDFATAPPDLAQATSCGSGTLNAGSVSSYAVGTTKRFTDNINYDLHVCRDAGGLFAVDSTCTHAGCAVTQQSTKWYCPCHGATFALDGTQPTAPATSPLPCYAVCVDASGNVWVDWNTTVSPSTRA
jgi:nitrite reductase/ring-hydroxylating ferredoxin subunit